MTSVQSRHEAYERQLAALAHHLRAGEHQSGWKVGATSPAMLTQHGLDLDEPLFGYLLARGELQSGAEVRGDTLASPALEFELCFTLGMTLAGPGATVEDALAATRDVRPAIEVVERRPEVAYDIDAVVAGNLEHHAYVVGGPVELPLPGVGLDSVELRVAVDGVAWAEATGAAVLGHPAASVAWLANKLDEFGLVLEPGARVMSGSFTGQLTIAPGDTVAASFVPVGRVELGCV